MDDKKLDEILCKTADAVILAVDKRLAEENEAQNGESDQQDEHPRNRENTIQFESDS